MEQKDLSGALFKNKDKQKSTHADYRGSATVNGVEYWISAWLNKAKSTGETYMSLSFTEKEKRAPVNSNVELDDVPF